MAFKPEQQGAFTMTIAQAVAFIQSANTDELLQQRIKGLSPTDPIGLIKVGKAAGFEFSVDEFKAGAETLGRFAGEMSDAELDRVAGGALNTYQPTTNDMGNNISKATIDFCKTFNFDVSIKP
jgi:predicted ribosomally synthesized peptide with nif11-like leader